MKMACVIALMVLQNTPGAQPVHAEPPDAAARLPRSVLREEYHPICRRPCELIGFSFAGPEAELLEMRSAGANTVGLGAMWRPVQDQSAPHGCGAQPPGGAGILGQIFKADQRFDGFAAHLPTGHSTDSGCSWTLLRVRGRDDEPERVADGRWPIVADNAWVEARLPEQAIGCYHFEISQPTGSWIGWWAKSGDIYTHGYAVIAGQPQRELDFEFRLHRDGEWQQPVPSGGPHQAVHLGPFATKRIELLRMNVDYSVGNWNNPGFPYYPDWFWQRFPDAAAVDQDGKQIVGGMFGKAVPAPGIEHPVIVDGTSRFISATVEQLQAERAIRYWVMGGEAMYATYGYKGRWTDYSDNAIDHFRAWLASRRYRNTIDALNRAWRTRYTRRSHHASRLKADRGWTGWTFASRRWANDSAGTTRLRAAATAAV